MMYMKYPLAKITFPFLLLPALAFCATPVAESTLPNETLHYNVNWPSGESLGEATLSASSSAGNGQPLQHMHFQFDLDASVPGFAVSDRFRSAASGTFCSVEFREKNLTWLQASRR